MRIKPSSYFLIFILLSMGVVIVSSIGMRYYESKLLPLIVSSITFALAAVELWRELRPKHTQPEIAEEGGAGVKGVPRRIGIAVGWVLGATLGVYLFGFLAAIALLILSYLKTRRRSWSVAISVAVATTALIYGIFQLALGFELYKGFIYNRIIG